VAWLVQYVITVSIRFGVFEGLEVKIYKIKWLASPSTPVSSKRKGRKKKEKKTHEHKTVKASAFWEDTPKERDNGKREGCWLKVSLDF